ncbi:phosphoenolpyruvate carboxykinase domain-containing protein [Nocardia takedensis]
MTVGTEDEHPAQLSVDHGGIGAWVAEVRDLTNPDEIVWRNGSRAEWEQLTEQLVTAGTFVRLWDRPDWFWCASDPGNVAPVEDRTFLCCEDESDATSTDDRVDPVDMRSVMTEHFRGSMVGRAMYVIGFCMGSLGDENLEFGGQITDSAYVAVPMQTMTRSGTQLWAALGAGQEFARCLHSAGLPLAEGRRDVAWPRDATKYIAHFPQARTLWSYVGNAVLGKEYFALRIVSAPGREDPARVPISALFFGGRRASTVPLITEAFDWALGVFLASLLSAETTAAAEGAVGLVRRDPMAMLPFLGYHVGDYFAHWLELDPAKLPKIFQVHWFRRDEDRDFLWPGFPDHVRVSAWVLDRIDGSPRARPTPIGYAPGVNALDTSGFDAEQRARTAAALVIDIPRWVEEAASINDWHARVGGNRRHEALREHSATLKSRLAGRH